MRCREDCWGNEVHLNYFLIGMILILVHIRSLSHIWEILGYYFFYPSWTVFTSHANSTQWVASQFVTHDSWFLDARSICFGPYTQIRDLRWSLTTIRWYEFHLYSFVGSIFALSDFTSYTRLCNLVVWWVQVVAYDVIGRSMRTGRIWRWSR